MKAFDIGQPLIGCKVINVEHWKLYIQEAAALVIQLLLINFVYLCIHVTKKESLESSLQPSMIRYNIRS